MKFTVYRLHPSHSIKTLFAIMAVLGTPLEILAAPPSNSPYYTDKQHSFVEDQTSQAIDQVNMIACFMSALKPADLVNKDPYVALVNKVSCDGSSRSDTSSSTDQSTGNAEYMRAIVHSTRADEKSPMRVKTWVENEEHDLPAPATIFINLSAKEAPSDTNPFGIFRMDFSMPNPSVANTLLMQGFIDSTANGLTFIQRENGGSLTEMTRLSLHKTSETSGYGATTLPDRKGVNLGNPLAIAFGYNTDYFKVTDNDGISRCFSRKLSDAKASVWRYGLYDGNTGKAIDIKAGFPISATLQNKVYHGYIGYNGLFFPPSVISQLKTGDTITQFTGDQQKGSATSTQYTLQKTRGRLTRYTKKSRSLDSIHNIPIQFFAQGTLTGLPEEALGKMLQAKWDKDTHSFIILGSAQCDKNGCKIKDLDSQLSISAATLSVQVSGGIRGFSQPLGGDVFIPIEALQDSTQSIFYRVGELVYPSDPTIQGKNFYCISNCMTAASLEAFINTKTVSISNVGGNQESPSNISASPFGTTENNFQPVAANALITYTLDNNGELGTNSLPAVWTNTQNLLNGTAYQSGIRSGRLVTQLSDIECTTGSNTYCAWKADQVPVYYIWETGSNAWNQFAGLKDGQSNWVTFDPPLQLSYKVPNDNVLYGEYAGQNLQLEYQGFGELHGIPGSCVSAKDNSRSSCEKSEARYVPAFSIPMSETDGIVSTEDNIHYLVKWLDREVRFQKVADIQCSGLTIGQTSELPDGTSELKDPSNAASGVDVYIGSKPDLTGAPRVIHGEVQY